MRKKLLSLLLCAALLVSLAACGNSTPTASTPSDTPSSSTEQQPTEQPSNEPEQPTEQPSEEPTEEPSEEPAPSEEPSGQPTEEPSEEPSTEPSEEPTVSGEVTEGSESDVGTEEPVEDNKNENPDADEPANDSQESATPDVETEVPTDEPTDEPNTTVKDETEDTTTSDEQPEEAVHTHSYNSYKSNNDGTHTVICTSTTGTCDAETYTETCNGDPCNKCGYTVPHTHNYKYTSNGDGTHTATCTSTTGSCAAKTYTENCSNDTCSKCGYTKPIQTPVDIIPNGWDGTGVNHSRNWQGGDDAALLASMPNTAKMLEQYPGYRAEGNLFAAGGVAIRNNAYSDALVLEGFTYSSVNQEKYEMSLAMLKDVMDSESASAFIGWLEELDELNDIAMDAVKTYGRESTELANALTAQKNHLTPLKADFVSFGNVKVKWVTEGSVINLIIRNK